MKEIKKLALVLGCVLLFILYYFLCNSNAEEVREYYSSGSTADGTNIQDISIEDAIHQYVIDNIEQEVKITGTGDIMFYDYQMERAYDSTTDSFDFSPSFQYISKYLTDSDYTLGNLEGTMAGKDNGASSNDYGYWADVQTLNFNIPEAAADDLKAAGFDMLTTANNHVLDSGIDGVASTIDFITGAGLDQTGSFKSESDQKYMIQDVNGINTGFIAYTNLMNETLDDSNSYIVNNLDNYSEDQISLMCSQIQQMRQEGAEFVVVSLHFGERYVSTVSDEERSLAQQLVEAGADVIFGSYPHVLKPMEVINVQGEDGTSRTGVVFYSLGNFLSSMQYQSSNQYPRDLGAVASVLISKDSNGVQIDGIEIVPTYVDWTDDDIAVLPICEVVDDPTAYEDRFGDDASSQLDQQRIQTGYESVIQTIIGDSGLTYTYSDYKYQISLEK